MRMIALISKAKILISQLFILYSKALHLLMPLPAVGTKTAKTGKPDIHKETRDEKTDGECYKKG